MQQPPPGERSVRPGWPEVATALGVYLVLVIALGLWMASMPGEAAALRGIAGMAGNGVAGALAFLAACALRIRSFDAFGFRAAGRRMLLAGAALGLVAYGLSFLVEGVYFRFVTEPDTQADFRAAAAAGLLPLLLLLVSGALLTPLGEELVFRGVVASALNRHGAVAGVMGSALVFAAAHGPSVIFFDALMVGLIAGALFRRTGSLWPPLLTHVVYNGLHLLHYSTL